MIGMFTEQLPLKGTAVLLAIVLWFVVNVKEPQVELVPVRLNTLLDSSLVLRDSIPPLKALVAGAPKELIKLNSNPLIIRRTIAADAPDTVVIDLSPDDVKLPDGVEAVVQTVSPQSVTLRFESMWSKKVPIKSSIDIATAQYPGQVNPNFEPESVVVTGPRHMLLGLQSVRTVKATIPFPDSLPHLVDIDTTGFGPARARPNQVKVLLRLQPHT
ncbi:MAG TPA: hypothetical protein VGM50_06335 [Gemmatimonadaceae bacterium]